ncbi:phosphoribosyl-AMP cyclohydrolase [Gulosibacter molinativorax]|uniref:Phosphoribosyl-AMP cyclohydrolase n=1 Tax=Gulosibacter molinativorax TaxID=256821 RepID=A0ABT7C797_9MICO|nr:phosphoribosyl-AMP cyclohydrolase [Gulosibacter molinativorax]MDJ1371081.1 phosphoribosyl-AMP cyclohydrolase [Gulosibacter molinativorax]QUY61441.1 Phosphoribosyl-AMP cyclohydrolase [Gulosibacter molinativorax]
MRSVTALEPAEIDEIVGALTFDDRGLIAAIAKQWDTGEVLMLAWMNEDSVRETLATRRAVYWSRSRGELWRKGDTSGHTQTVMSFQADCDADTILLGVDQVGAACHLNTRTCWDSDPLAVAFAEPTAEESLDR